MIKMYNKENCNKNHNSSKWNCISSAGDPHHCEGTLSVSWAHMEPSPGSPRRASGVTKTFKKVNTSNARNPKQ